MGLLNWLKRIVSTNKNDKNEPVIYSTAVDDHTDNDINPETSNVIQQEITEPEEEVPVMQTTYPPSPEIPISLPIHMTTDTSYNSYTAKPNASALDKAMDYFHKVVHFRLQNYSQPNTPPESVPSFIIPDEGSAFSQFLLEKKLEETELIVLMTALVPHLDPGFYWRLLAQYFPNGAEFPEFGGIKGTNHRGILPTGETALFFAAGNDLHHRFAVQQVLSSDHFLVKERIVWLDDAPPGEPAISGKLVMATEKVSLLTLGFEPSPQFSTQFPAQRIETNLSWQDLVLSEELKEQIKEIQIWVEHEEFLRTAWDMQKRIKPGYRALFYGPPGTGKTLTASLLGKYATREGEKLEREVYKIDLSMVVSKYIGETEKNLSNLFARAENKKWILFFDEADALFGKRTNVRDAHDKYANQEVSYLLQRIEDYNGLIILASNMKSNMDEAFLRRFNTTVKFALPDERERLLIWQKAFPSQIAPDDDHSLLRKAAKYDLTGGNIINVVQYVCLKAASSEKRSIEADTLLEGIKREYVKEGKIFQNR